MGMETPTTSGFATEADYNKLEHFRRHFISPPPGLYVTVDDIVLVRGFAQTSTQTVNVSLRMLAPNGEIISVFQPVAIGANGNVPTLFALRNLEGFILSASVQCTGVQRGQLFVALLVQRGAGSGDATLGQVFLQGYVSNTDTLGYPQHVPYSGLDGRGQIQLVAVGNPAAGADWVYTVPAGAHQIVRSVSALFTAAVAVANRFPVLTVDNGIAAVVAEVPATAVIVAATAIQLTWAPGLNQLNVNSVQTMGSPIELRALGGWRVKTVTSGIQAADQWSGIVVVLESFCAQ